MYLAIIRARCVSGPVVLPLPSSHLVLRAVSLSHAALPVPVGVLQVSPLPGSTLEGNINESTPLHTAVAHAKEGREPLLACLLQMTSSVLPLTGLTGSRFNALHNAGVSVQAMLPRCNGSCLSLIHT